MSAWKLGDVRHSRGWGYDSPQSGLTGKASPKFKASGLSPEMEKQLRGPSELQGTFPQHKIPLP